jgi:hypothetical protein
VLRRGEVVDALQRAREADKTRYLGYSGDGEAAHEAVACDAFDTLQTSVNLADQEAIDLTLPLASARGMGMIAKRLLVNVAWRHGTRPTDPYIQVYWAWLQLLDYDCLQQPLGEAVGARRNAMGFAHPIRLCTTRQFPTSGLCCDAGYATLRCIKGTLGRYRRVPFPGIPQQAALHTTHTDGLASLAHWTSSRTGK